MFHIGYKGTRERRTKRSSECILLTGQQRTSLAGSLSLRFATLRKESFGSNLKGEFRETTLLQRKLSTRTGKSLRPEKSERLCSGTRRTIFTSGLHTTTIKLNLLWLTSYLTGRSGHRRSLRLPVKQYLDSRRVSQ